MRGLDPSELAILSNIFAITNWLCCCCFINSWKRLTVLVSIFPAAILCVFVVIPGFYVPDVGGSSTPAYTMVTGTDVSGSKSLLE